MFCSFRRLGGLSFVVLAMSQQFSAELLAMAARLLAEAQLVQPPPPASVAAKEEVPDDSVGSDAAAASGAGAKSKATTAKAMPIPVASLATKEEQGMQKMRLHRFRLCQWPLCPRSNQLQGLGS